MATKTLQDQLIDKAYELQESYNNILETRDANRRTLRDLAAQGLLSGEQVGIVEELYPRRQMNRNGDEVSE